MKLNKIFFSPTKTTKKILDGITKGLAVKEIEEFDISKLDEDFHHEIQSGITLIGMPVYNGKLPELAVRHLNKFSADKQICIVVVSYGDKDYKKSLIALKNQAKDNGFIPIATAAFIGENSFSENNEPIAIDKLDEADIIACYNFGQKIKSKLNSDEDIINNVLNKTVLKEKDT